MAIYHLTAKVISRGKGQSAVAAAAYRSGEKLRDEQTGDIKHYRARAERIDFTGIFAPADAPEWAHSRNDFWNQAERFEKRKDAQLAREIEVSLPHELTDQQREWLVKDFAREQFVRRGYVVDVAIHGPDADSDQRNHHAHLMISMRTVGPEGFAPMKDRSLNSREQLQDWREEWAHLANRHLERHGHEARIDHRSLEAQGIDREPTIHVGIAALAMVERGRDVESGTVEVAKTFLPNETRQIRYAEIDQGSRVAFNEQIIARNLARERSADQELEPAALAEPSPEPPRPLTTRERMEASWRRIEEEQRAAAEAAAELPPEAEPSPERKRGPHRPAGNAGMEWTDRAGMVAQQNAALEEAQRRQREQDEQRREASPDATIENSSIEKTDARQRHEGSEAAREKSDRVHQLSDWIKARATDRGERDRDDDGGRDR